MAKRGSKQVSGDKQAQSNEPYSITRRIVMGIVLIAAGIMLFFAQSAYWVNHSIFNKDNFSRITSEALLSNPSRQAISAAIVDKALSDKPIIKSRLGDRIESLVGGLLASDFSNSVISALSTRTYEYVTSTNRKDIEINIVPVKEPLQAIINLSEEAGRSPNVEIENIPDQVILVRKNEFPNYSSLVTTMLWLGPLFWLLTVILFGVYIFLGRDNYSKRVYISGVAIIIVGLLGIALNPFVPPPIASVIQNIQLRPVATSLASGFLEPFRYQMIYMIIVTSVLLLLFSLRYKMRDFISSIGTSGKN